MMQIFNRRPTHILCSLLLSVAAILVFDNAAATDISDIKAEVRFLYVQPGQTLHNIVRRLYPGQEARWPQIRREIVHLNRAAFINGDEASMKAGVRLTLPGKAKSRQVLKPVGSVMRVDGRVIAVGQDKVTRQLVAGDKVYVGDKLITGEDGFLRLSMVDNAKLDLRCFSIMVIEEYQIKNADRRSILKLLQGSLRKVSGEIGKMVEDIYELQTPIASVGVRGTEYALRVFQSKGCGGTIDTNDDGLFLQVIKGLVDVQNAAGTTTVAKGNQLYIPLPDTLPEDKTIAPGVFEPVTPKPVVKIAVEEKKKEKEEGTSWWWYLLGVIAIAVAL